MIKFQHQQFSKDLKIQKINYLDKKAIDWVIINQYMDDLETIDLTTIEGDAEKKAFWINIYNGLTNYWIIKKKIKKTMLEKPLLFGWAKVNIAGYQWALDTIEHGILRRNHRSPLSFFKPFSKKDDRLTMICDQLDYRIHFALNCGGVSCPPIAFYSAENIDQELNIAEESFAEQEFSVDINKKEIRCSRIFTLYKKDFKLVYVNDPKYQGFKIKNKKYSFAIS